MRLAHCCQHLLAVHGAVNEAVAVAGAAGARAAPRAVAAAAAAADASVLVEVWDQALLVVT